MLFRKIRPKTWDELIAHEQVIESIKNCLKKDKIPSAFLFYGIRGVGKTTIARILARCLSCPESSIDPCGKCKSCLNFDNHLDILEIDAASKTGVDDIRELIDSCQYTPLMGLNKIFIIDEVHMLSKSAFNALLKTLEEPPEHVKFIFATTELQKIPDTILSRCTIYQLKPVNQSKISSFLQKIAKNESIDVSSEICNILAESSEGSVRDAITLLEQAAMLNPDNITESEVLKMLGKANESDIQELLDLILESNSTNASEKTTKILQNGADPLIVYKQLQKVLYDRIIKNVKSDQLNNLLYLWQILLKQSENFNNAIYPDFILNATVIILSQTCSFPDLSSLDINQQLSSK